MSRRETFTFRIMHPVAFVPIACIALMAGCGGESQTAPPAPVAVASVSTSPEQANLDEGGTVQLQAVARGVDGSTVNGRTITWTTSEATTATVSNVGLVTGTGHGTTTITAVVDGKTGSSSVTVRGKVAAVTVTPPSPGIEQDQTVLLAASVTTGNGAAVSDRVVVWSTNNPAIASVSSGGLVTGTGHGVALITAATEGILGTASVTVRGKVASVTVAPVGQTLAEDATLQLSP